MIPATIKSWRIAAGLSRMQLAAALGVHVDSVGGWEREKKPRPCSAKQLGAIGRACGVKPLERLRAVLDAAGEGEDAEHLWALLGVGGGAS